MNYVTQEWKSPLLRPRLVREDVYIQGLTQDEVEMIREALGKGLMPSGFEVVEDTLILRFDRPLKPAPGLLPYCRRYILYPTNAPENEAFVGDLKG